MTTGIPQRGRLFPSLSADLATLRLVRMAQALQLSRLEDPDTARALVDRTKAVRAFVEAGEPELAELTLGQLLAVEVNAAAKNSIKRRVTAVKGALSIG